MFVCFFSLASASEFFWLLSRFVGVDRVFFSKNNIYDMFFAFGGLFVCLSKRFPGVGCISRSLGFLFFYNRFV